ncbi:hypothetical protein L1049_002111 [Liquidambar formosana]|uniref:UTP23 sensor motif region domain-containing protein n=1 Tax=Liquidambar formosana TaxID=63359 RepID=A0AAP0NFD9_LIQFO
MRLKRQKRNRKVVRFYTACFGFRPSFKVLCDGTFVHHLLVNDIMPADNALSNLLGATAKLFTTRCVLAELKRLGNSYSESLKAARSLTIARCDHERRKSAVDCIMEIVGENNPDHFFVATQDNDLRKKFQKIPGVPVIFGLRNALFIEQPSAFQRQFVKSTEEERLHMTELDYKILNMKVKERLATDEVRDTPDADECLDQTLGTQAVTKTNSARKRTVVKDKAQFKRKRAKGPNPLSCKKKSHRQPNLVSEKVNSAFSFISQYFCNTPPPPFSPTGLLIFMPGIDS